MDMAAQNSSSSPTTHNRLRTGFIGVTGAALNANQVAAQTAPAQTDLVSKQDKLAIIEEVLNQVEQERSSSAKASEDRQLPPRIAASGMVAQAVPRAINEVSQLQQAQQGASVQKETQAVNVFESIPGAQIEYEASPEIAPEVEAFVKEAEEHDRLPQEIAVSADQVTISPAQKRAKKAVVVLPITQQVEKTGAKKNPKFSIRWLVEFARKIMKIFDGEVIYRDPGSSSG